MPENIRESVLNAAKEIVTKDRNADYDTPEKNFETISELWETYLDARNPDARLDPHDVAVLMILVKVARIVTSPKKVDHWIDIAGYAACGAECIVEEPKG